MSRHCANDWFWIAFVAAAFEDNPRCGCPPRATRGEEDWYRDDEPRVGVRTASRTPRRPWTPKETWVVIAAVAIGLAALLPPASPAYLTTAVAPVASEPLPPATDDRPSPKMRPAPSPLNVPVLSTEDAMLALPGVPAHDDETLLPSLPFGDGDAVTLVDVAPVFHVGSSQAEVIAAQGREPTFAARDGRSLWWGSSTVTFSRDGRVIAWRDGLPPLMVRRD